MKISSSSSSSSFATGGGRTRDLLRTSSKYRNSGQLTRALWKSVRAWLRTIPNGLALRSSDFLMLREAPAEESSDTSQPSFASGTETFPRNLIGKSLLSEAVPAHGQAGVRSFPSRNGIANSIQSSVMRFHENKTPVLASPAPVQGDKFQKGLPGRSERTSAAEPANLDALANPPAWEHQNTRLVQPSQKGASPFLHRLRNLVSEAWSMDRTAQSMTPVAMTAPGQSTEGSENSRVGSSLSIPKSQMEATSENPRGDVSASHTPSYGGSTTTHPTRSPSDVRRPPGPPASRRRRATSFNGKLRRSVRAAGSSLPAKPGARSVAGQENARENGSKKGPNAGGADAIGVGPGGVALGGVGPSGVGPGGVGPGGVGPGGVGGPAEGALPSPRRQAQPSAVAQHRSRTRNKDSRQTNDSGCPQNSCARAGQFSTDWSLDLLKRYEAREVAKPLGMLPPIQ